MARGRNRNGGDRSWAVERNYSNARQETLYRMYLRVLGELAMNRFEWKGFEDSAVNVRYLEMMLYKRALAVIVKDHNIRRNNKGEDIGNDKVWALAATPNGVRNLVDDPTAYLLSGPGFQGNTVMMNQCVPVWANYFRQPDHDIVEIYASKLARLDRTIEINSDNARRSKILVFNEESKLTGLNINEMIERGEPYIPVSFQMGDLATALDLGIDPRTVTELSVLRSRLWNECMGLLGINNSNQDKKERLVAAEVGANDEQVESARRANLNARQMAAEQINDMFEMDVSVDYYSNAAVETVNPATVEQTGAV